MKMNRAGRTRNLVKITWRKMIKRREREIRMNWMRVIGTFKNRRGEENKGRSRESIGGRVKEGREVIRGIEETRRR